MDSLVRLYMQIDNNNYNKPGLYRLAYKLFYTHSDQHSMQVSKYCCQSMMLLLFHLNRLIIKHYQTVEIKRDHRCNPSRLVSTARNPIRLA